MDRLQSAGHCDGPAVRLWNLASGELLADFETESGAHAVLLFPDGSCLVTGDAWSGPCDPWEAISLADVRPASGHSGTAAVGACFGNAADGHSIAVRKRECARTPR
nr:hypothetical protein OG409_02430 [Streptomyces sp. NBC_00974]